MNEITASKFWVFNWWSNITPPHYMDGGEGGRSLLLLTLGCGGEYCEASICSDALSPPPQPRKRNRKSRVKNILIFIVLP